MNLCDIDNNDTVIIKKIRLNDIKKRRLYDLGFINGEKVKRMFSSIFDNPVCYKVKNTFIALRNEDAYYIEVEHE